MSRKAFFLINFVEILIHSPDSDCRSSFAAKKENFGDGARWRLLAVWIIVVLSCEIYNLNENKIYITDFFFD